MPLSEREVELVNIRSEVQDVEKRIDLQFHIFERREAMPYAINDDFSQRSVTFTVYYDQLNLAQMDSIFTQLRELITQHRKLREREARSAQAVMEEKAIEGQIAKGWRQHA